MCFDFNHIYCEFADDVVIEVEDLKGVQFASGNPFVNMWIKFKGEALNLSENDVTSPSKTSSGLFAAPTGEMKPSSETGLSIASLLIRL